MKVADHSGPGNETENVVREGSSNHPLAASELKARGELHLGQQIAKELWEPQLKKLADGALQLVRLEAKSKA